MIGFHLLVAHLADLQASWDYVTDFHRSAYEVCEVYVASKEGKRAFKIYSVKKFS